MMRGGVRRSALHREYRMIRAGWSRGQASTTMIGVLDRFRTHPVQLGIAVWLALGSVAAVFIWQLDTSDRTLGSRLSAHGVTTLATVTGTDAANHNTVFYSYVANGRTYHSGYFGRGPEGDASQLTVGQRIHVVYDSEDPSASCYCSVADLAKSSDWWRTLLAGLFLASVGSVAVTLGISRRWKGQGPGAAAPDSA
jgi:hypothetical protein